jgi:hypothetical protein
MTKDKQLDILTAQINLRTLDKALELSIEDIKRNHPTRLDLITPMETRLVELKEAQLVFLRLHTDHEATIKKIYALHTENLTLKKQVNDLKILL